MGNAKLQSTVLRLSLVAVLLISAAIQETTVARASKISYDVINRDDVPEKEGLHRPDDAEANKYTRGCEAEEECRSQ
jgi:hypothetical protein